MLWAAGDVVPRLPDFDAVVGDLEGQDVSLLRGHERAVLVPTNVLLLRVHNASSAVLYVVEQQGGPLHV